MSANTAKGGECCPKFDPAPWEGTTFEWKKKRFIKERVFTVLYLPLNFGRVMRRVDANVRSAGGTIPDGLSLSDHTSKWNMDLYVAVDREIPGAVNTTLSGRFLSKVYEGPFKETGKWCESFRDFARGMGVSVRKWYMWYTTCPKCAKKRGKNYVAILGEVE